MDLQNLINQAKEFKASGKLASALSCYNAVMDQLSEEAADYARSQPGSYADIGKIRSLTPRYFECADSYLRRNNVASRVSNNMGVIFAELKNFESAKKYFLEAIRYTPENENYPDPEINLKNLT